MHSDRHLIDLFFYLSNMWFDMIVSGNLSVINNYICSFCPHCCKATFGMWNLQHFAFWPGIFLWSFTYRILSQLLPFFLMRSLFKTTSSCCSAGCGCRQFLTKLVQLFKHLKANSPSSLAGKQLITQLPAVCISENLNVHNLKLQHLQIAPFKLLSIKYH